MKSMRRTKSVAIILACAAAGAFLLARPLTGIAAGLPGDDAMPTSQPAPEVTPQRSVQEIVADFQATNKQLAAVVPPKVFADAAARNDAAPKAVPILYRRLQLIEELSATKKIAPVQIAGLKQSCQSMLYAMNDQPTVTKVKGMLASTDSVRQIDGQSIELQARWMTAVSDKTEAGKVMDELEKLDRANPGNSRLTLLTLDLAQGATGPEKDRLLGLIKDVMTDQYAEKLKPQISAQLETDAKQTAMLDKPFVIAAKTVDGKDFTTADWKGKVVLIDFWATWCGPCRAGLPHVIDTYNKYHDKGLELVGVSNDYDADSLKQFTPKNNMPWPQLFDADAAADHKWNPISLNNGVEAIPAMFLIDKKGNLRSVTAREDMDDLIPKLLAE